MFVAKARRTLFKLEDFIIGIRYASRVSQKVLGFLVSLNSTNNNLYLMFIRLALSMHLLSHRTIAFANIRTEDLTRLVAPLHHVWCLSGPGKKELVS